MRSGALLRSATLQTLLAKERGIAMPTAVSLLMVVSLLVAAGLATATQLSQSSNRDQDKKRALSAAEAGLQTAIYRLNQIRNPVVPGGMCLTTGPVAPDGVTGECPTSPTESLGNGASFYYYVTPRLGVSGACSLQPGQVATERDRCVTAIGVADGVTRRLQVRVSEQDVFGGFFDVGLLGKSLVYAYNSINMTADIGSNSAVYLNNSVTADGHPHLGIEGTVKLLEGGSYTAINSVNVEGGLTPITQPYEMPQADFERYDGESGGLAAPSENNNALLPAANYDAANKSFIINSGTVTINPGTYYFCHVKFGNSVNFRINNTGLNTSNGMTRFLVDHPRRTGSNCPASPTTYIADHAGTFGVDESVDVNKETAAREELFQIYMYGSANEQESLTTSRYSWCPRSTSPVLPGECRADFMLDNSVEFYGTVYAPDSTVQAHNSVQVFGGLAGDKIRLFNSVTFEITDAARTAPALTPGAVRRTGWTECRTDPTTIGDPESGC
jgi:type II secretory pathway pseudopilin PulG